MKQNNNVLMWLILAVVGFLLWQNRRQVQGALGDLGIGGGPASRPSNGNGNGNGYTPGPDFGVTFPIDLGPSLDDLIASPGGGGFVPTPGYHPDNNYEFGVGGTVGTLGGPGCGNRPLGTAGPYVPSWDPNYRPC